MTYKQIQTAHEVRMWIKTIAVGAIATGVFLERHPEAKEKVRNGIEGIKAKFRKPKTKTIKIVVINGEES